MDFSTRLEVGLDDLFQPEWFYGSMILNTSSPTSCAVPSSQVPCVELLCSAGRFGRSLMSGVTFTTGECHCWSLIIQNCIDFTHVIVLRWTRSTHLPLHWDACRDPSHLFYPISVEFGSVCLSRQVQLKAWKYHPRTAAFVLIPRIWGEDKA